MMPRRHQTIACAKTGSCALSPFSVAYTTSISGRQQMLTELLRMTTERDAIAAVIKVGHDFELNACTHRMSSLQDLEAGRPLEIHETFGFALQEAASRQLPLPLVEAFYHLRTRVTITYTSISAFSSVRGHSSNHREKRRARYSGQRVPRC